MSRLKQVQQNTDNLISLEMLTRAYGEIASVRMKKARAAVLHSRKYQSAIDDIFKEVQKGYAKEIKKLARKLGRKKKGGLTFLSHNGKSVAVFVSANTRLYGDLINKSFKQFAQEIEEKQSEATVIGRYGRMLYLSKFPDRPYTFFDMPDHKTPPEKLESIVKHLVQYTSISVYFAKFQSLLKQVALSRNISSREMELSTAGDEETNKYVFEPDLANILVFFESQIFASTFEQLVKESQLAKFASRIMAMDRAGVNIRKSIKKAKLKELKLKHFLINKKQQGSLSSRYLGGFNKL